MQETLYGRLRLQSSARSVCHFLTTNLRFISLMTPILVSSLSIMAIKYPCLTRFLVLMPIALSFRLSTSRYAMQALHFLSVKFFSPARYMFLFPTPFSLADGIATDSAPVKSTTSVQSFSQMTSTAFQTIHMYSEKKSHFVNAKL